jgi:hypothetical protein
LNKLKNVGFAAAAAVPLLTVFPGCDFHRLPPQPTSAIFCNIEADRRCATLDDLTVGVDMARQYEDGFWTNKSGNIGLDYVAGAAECGPNQAIAYVYRGPFPDGSPVCRPPTEVDDEDLNVVCKTWCSEQEWIDGDGNPYNCQNIAWAATAPGPYADSCTSGALRGDFEDPRRATPTPTPAPTSVPSAAVVWTGAVNVEVTGNSLRKNAGIDGEWDAGAFSTQVLGVGASGYVELVATETNRARMCGLALGADANPVYTDIDFAVYLQADGLLSVWRLGVQDQTLAPIPYSAGDKIRVDVSPGTVRYFKNGTQFHMHAAQITEPIRVDASLLTLLPQGATLTDARVSF